MNGMFIVFANVQNLYASLTKDPNITLYLTMMHLSSLAHAANQNLNASKSHRYHIVFVVA